jgi:ParB family chromosome partitioning protein
MTKKKKISSYFKDRNITCDDNAIISNNKNKTVTQKYSKHHLYDSPDFDHNTVLEIDPSLVSNWKFHDRPKEELGDIEALSSDMKTIGQQQPCIVRLLHKNIGEGVKYEIIAGERRWRASILANIPLKVIVKEIDDSTAALIQIAENENRKNLSDFARANSLQTLISNNILRQIDLVSKLNKSKQYISALLSYQKIPFNVSRSIGNFTNVSASLAEKIKQLSFKGENYQNAIIELGDKISQGKFGKSSLESAVLKKINNNKTMIKRIHNKNGEHIFSVQYYKKSIAGIQFTKIGRNKLLNNISIEEDNNELVNALKVLLND